MDGELIDLGIEVVTLALLMGCAGVAGLAVMGLAEYSLYDLARAADFEFQHGRYNFLRVLRPHLLHGIHRGRDVWLAYSLGQYLSDAPSEGIWTIAYGMPPHRRVHLRVTRRWPCERRGRPSGDACFDWRLCVRGGPVAFLDALLADASIRRRLLRTLAPLGGLGGQLTMTRAGPLVLSHRSIHFGRARIRRGMELLADIAAVVERYAAEGAVQPEADGSARGASRRSASSQSSSASPAAESAASSEGRSSGIESK
jgi:hypothetical protein